MNNHTPGPWFAHGEPEATEIRARGGTKIICDTDATPHANMPEAIANARLIAAAPDLLAALETIASISGSTGGPAAMVREFQFLARAAIAKAKGEREATTAVPDERH